MNTAIITVSDSRHAANDISGDTLAQAVIGVGGKVVERLIVSDDPEGIREMLLTLSERRDIDLIVTTGGTGCGPRDNTPEATLAVIEREVPGMSETMRRETASMHPFAMLARGVCGIRGRTLIVNLPGSPKGVAECFEAIRPVLGHAVSQISGQTDH